MFKNILNDPSNKSQLNVPAVFTIYNKLVYDRQV